MKLWPPCNIHKTVKIGEGTKIGAFCDIGKNVVIGKDCNIQAHVTISNGCKIGDKVFIGPNTSLLNDLYMNGEIQPVIIEDEARIGGGVTVRPNVTIGFKSKVACGVTVTKNVPPLTEWVGRV